MLPIYWVLDPLKTSFFIYHVHVNSFEQLHIEVKVTRYLGDVTSTFKKMFDAPQTIIIIHEQRIGISTIFSSCLLNKAHFW